MRKLVVGEDKRKNFVFWLIGANIRKMSFRSARNAEIYIVSEYIRQNEVSTNLVFTDEKSMLAHWEEVGYAAYVKDSDCVLKPADLQRLARDFRTNVNELVIQRHKCGLTQAELAALSGVNQVSIARFEKNNRGLKSARFETLEKLSKALHCSVSDLLINES